MTHYTAIVTDASGAVIVGAQVELYERKHEKTRLIGIGESREDGSAPLKREGGEWAK